MVTGVILLAAVTLDTVSRRRLDRGRDGEAMKTSLGIWALGPMVTRFVPGGYQPQHRGRDDGRAVAARSRGSAT